MIPLRRNNHVVSQCAYHLVWCTKYRRPVLTSEDPRLGNPVIDGDPGPVDVRLKQIVAEVCQEKEADLLDIEVMPDHVHALIALTPPSGSTSSRGSSKAEPPTTSDKNSPASKDDYPPYGHCPTSLPPPAEHHSNKSSNTSTTNAINNQGRYPSPRLRTGPPAHDW